MLEDVRAVLRPGARVLDAGAGTGAPARQIVAMEPAADVTLLDASPAMLERATDFPGDHQVGDVQALPFADDSFDLVVGTWVIETVEDPIAAAREFVRVINDDGHVLYAFCFCLTAGSRARAPRSCADRRAPVRRPLHAARAHPLARLRALSSGALHGRSYDQDRATEALRRRARRRGRRRRLSDRAQSIIPMPVAGMSISRCMRIMSRCIVRMSGLRIRARICGSRIISR
jgi:SAM-dependent methyltransferase